ncbi:protein kinase regulator [Cryptococcus bacillisporus CA1873]|uniref:Protein kinase regulator n=1 Tax=Cryptococcus bacillisporus CA1873 TaxID=1296111 RepID=A0ABR5BEI4_CRYGA|nr:protein kinase regulator [Cryptococcus bacillisporus CA1873]|eukprot:KIR67533.1 protein kinase regulator [Cryptococcus gattii CA1873]
MAAAVISPTKASPPVSVLQWDEDAVVSYLSNIGLGQYEAAIHEHRIAGDVLVALDHGTLQDMGMSSVGHRLTLLRAVYELKMEEGLEIGEDEWRPPEIEDRERLEAGRLLEIVRQQQERLSLIERDHDLLRAALEERGISVPYAQYAFEETLSGSVSKRPNELERSNSYKWRDFKDSDNAEHAPSTSRPRPEQLFPASLASSALAASLSAPLSSNSATFQDSFTPTTSNHNYVDSPTASGTDRRDGRPVNRVLAESSNLASSTSSSPSMAPPALSSQSLSASPTKPPSYPSVSSSAPIPGPLSHSINPSDKERSRAKDAARSAAKSFRVTLEDPCWKVLPAALKKYKINDDWRLYALFICYDNTGESTERCLSYDEKPLLLFQKLKETGHKPVFMLRHIKDIKSPVYIAHIKQAQKLGFPPNTTATLLPKIKPATDTSLSPTKPNTFKPAIPRTEDGQTPNGTAFPELPSPGLRDGDAGGRMSNGQLVDPDGSVVNVTYGVAIYPYCRDREDEFDVPVGSTYVIRSKNKGWYIVNRDPDATGIPNNYTQGWVPAGCLLELNQPMSIISPSPDGQIAPYPGLAPLPPSHIISSSYAGFVLMDYVSKGDDELTLKEGEKVRVYKKYCHWSYVIRNDTGERGWVPAWFVGKTSITISAGLREAETAVKPKPSSGSKSTDIKLDQGAIDGEANDDKRKDEAGEK